jgi:putative peptidoglycan lipid II flippase
MNQSRPPILRSSLFVSAFSLFVALISLVNQLVIARLFGAGATLDLYLQAISVPVLFSGVLGGVFAYLMVPSLVRDREKAADPRTVNVAFLITFVLLALLLAVGGALATPFVLRSFAVRSTSPEDWAAAQLIARLAWAASAAGILVGFLSAVHNASSRFVLPVLASALPYLGMIAVAILFRDRGPMSLAAGLLVGTLLAAAWLVAGARAEFARRPSRADFEPVRGFLRAMPITLVAVLAFTSLHVVDAFWAPHLGAGNLSYLGYSQRLLIALGTVMATGPTSVLQPRLALAIAQNRTEDYLRDLALATRVILGVCIPIVLLVSLFAPEVVRLVFERGSFTGEDTTGVARILPWMLIGSVPMVTVVLLFRGLYARHDTRSALVLGLLGPAIYFTLSGLLSRRFGIQGIGAAYVTTWSVLLLVGLSRIWGSARGIQVVLGSSRFWTRLALAVAAVVAVAIAGKDLALGNPTLGNWTLALRLVGVGGVCAAVYAVMTLWLAPVDELQVLRTAVSRRSSGA